MRGDLPSPPQPRRSSASTCRRRFRIRREPEKCRPDTSINQSLVGNLAQSDFEKARIVAHFLQQQLSRKERAVLSTWPDDRVPNRRA